MSRKRTTRAVPCKGLAIGTCNRALHAKTVT